ncbi:MAG: hypothetical protein HOY75_08060 [Streptomyces sp.]|nr:hypothetical protein [Streptomyces sp.]
MADHNDDQQPSSQELAAMELYHQLLNLSDDDGDRALMVTLRLPSGRYVGDVWLSQKDVEDVADSLIERAIRRADAAEGLIPAEPLPICEDDLTAETVDDTIAEFEHLLANGGDQA